MFYVWGTSADSVDLTAAQRLVNSLETDGVLTSRTCNPNRTTIAGQAWRDLPSDGLRENIVKALARVCLAEGGGRDMQILEATTGRTLAMFDGWNIQ